MKLPPPLLTVVHALAELREETVFVGGIIRALLVTDPAVIGARPTDDVDLIVDVDRSGYVALAAQLRSRGFREDDSEGAPICRWRIKDVPVDVMPIDAAVFGFSNVWYPSGLQHSIRHVADGEEIATLSAVYFCATKLEAFSNRGARNGQLDYFHHDLEDVVAIVDGCPSIIAEVGAAADDVRTYIASAIAALLSQQQFLDALPGHLAPDDASQARAPLILSRLGALAALVPSGER